MECDDEAEIFGIANICELGGGFISLGANAIDLSTICTTPSSECEIGATYKDKSIENRNPIEVSQIKVTTSITKFTNHSTITSTQDQTFLLENDNSNSTGKISHFINHGNISGGIKILGENADIEITNHGLMRGVWTMYKPITITINNLGIFETAQGGYVTTDTGAVHFAFENNQTKLIIENYAMNIRENQSDFNNFTSYHDKANNKNSHLIILYNGHTPTADNVYFKNAESKLILDFSDEFELGKAYLISKLVVDRSGDSIEALGVDFSRLMPKSDIYLLSQSGEYFIAKLAPQYSAIGNLYKSNIRTMNNFTTMSNAMIYPRKYHKSQNLWRKHSLLQHSLSLAESHFSYSPSLAEGARGWVEYPLLLDSANSLKSYESFAYRNESQTRRIKRPNKRNYSRTKRNDNLVILSDSEESKKKNRDSLPMAQNDNYYFNLTPFINHNLFFESGRYNLSGFDYGFLTAFSARVAESNFLGTHFMMSYGSLSDSHDKNFRVSNLNLNLGLNYKLDLAWDMYLKARGDVFYFLNALDSATLKNIKPNNFGFGASVLFGKEWDFKSGGVLGIEAGLDYKALQSNNIELHDNTYRKQLYNLIYVDLGVNYAKYFGGFGINLGGGFKANLAPQLAQSILLANSQNRIFVLDNDKYLGYANAALSYILNTRKFDMEFSIAYYGNFGDRAISNGGGFEWRTTW